MMKYILFTFVLIFSSCVRPQILPIGLTVNPYGSTPLSAIYRISETNSTPLTVSVLGKSKELSIAHTYPPYYSTIFPIHGLYHCFTNTVIISHSGYSMTNLVFVPDIFSNSFDIHTNIVPSKTRVQIDRLSPSDPFYQHLYFVNNNLSNITAYDRKGCLRYLYTNTNKVTIMEVEDSQPVFYTMDQKLIRHTLLGQQKYISTKGISVHHEFARNGSNLIMLATSKFGGVDDRLIEIDSQGNIVRDLIFGDFIRNVLDPDQHYILSRMVYDSNNVFTNKITQKPESVDWAHANSLAYDPVHDIIYLSLRHLGVVAVGYSEWKLLWWMSDDSINTRKGKGYGFVPANFLYFHQIPQLQNYRMKVSSGPKNQHSLLLKQNGNLLMFDNQGDEDFNPRGSRVIEYQIKRNSSGLGGKASIVRQYRHPIRTYSRLLADVDLSGENFQNWLILWGYSNPHSLKKTTRLTEIDPKNRILFDMTLGTDFIYRVQKIPLYSH